HAHAGSLGPDGLAPGVRTAGGRRPGVCGRGDLGARVRGPPPSLVTPSRALPRELQRLLRDRRIPGGACGLFDATGLLLSAVAGVRRAGRPAPVDPRDSWHVGSVTKAITADVCRTLDQLGLMPLETTVADGLR